MSLSQPTNTENSSLTRDVLAAVRYYLGGWRTRLVLTIVVAAAGLALNWNWLVAIGLAPILLSTLPCLVMCAFGVCTMCRSDREESTTRMANHQDTSLLSSDSGVPRPTAACCHQSGRDAAPLDGHRGLNHVAAPSPADQKSEKSDRRPV